MSKYITTTTKNKNKINLIINDLNVFGEHKNSS